MNLPRRILLRCVQAVMDRAFEMHVIVATDGVQTHVYRNAGRGGASLGSVRTVSRVLKMTAEQIDAIAENELTILAVERGIGLGE